MLSRKKLIQLALSELPSETEYLDYKQQIDLASDKGRAKLIKLIAAMSNSNPQGMSFIIVGVTDRKNVIGASFIDDAKLQNAIRGYLESSPKVRYENVTHDQLPQDKFIGLITIYPENSVCRVSKKIWKLCQGSTYYRIGSTIIDETALTSDVSFDGNVKDSMDLVKNASVSLESTIDALLKFYKTQNEAYKPRHYVFHDQYVVGVSGYKSKRSEFLSEVTVSLINEEVSYFWSALENVKIVVTENTLIVYEMKIAFWNKKLIYFPFKEVTFNFLQGFSYEIIKSLNVKFNPLKQEEIDVFLNSYQNKLDSDESYLEYFPFELLLAALNGSEKARDILFSRNNGNIDGAVAEAYQEAINTYKEAVNFEIF